MQFTTRHKQLLQFFHLNNFIWPHTTNSCTRSWSEANGEKLFILRTVDLELTL